ncbi:hypothetical protein K2173_008907 [Erythroxylum novogranatense]|uniref:NADP-dependent oxidoreductase domain-containing protein n=1 Tax=Erythroxylum novogranatense TaxID=1862640 RepID=A0AAV8S4V2_9ROSI|nr:hypothetical protein K2173_008907 [Erythroxylum novogranatense]
MASDILVFQLSNGVKIPSVGLGTWQAESDIVGAAVEFAIKIHRSVRMKKGSTGLNPENFVNPDIPGTWRALEALYDAGKARAIGVSNFSSKKLGDLLEQASVPPAMNQVECHSSWEQAKLRAFCKSKGVHLSVSRKKKNYELLS